MHTYFENETKLFAFNILDINSARAVMDAAAEMKKNVILQTSASIYKEVLPKRLREFVTGYQQDIGIKAWLHLDHCKTTDIIYDAIENGWDSVMIDASAKAIDENIRITNEITEYAHSRNVPVEAEIGQVKGIEDDIVVRSVAVASIEDIDRFIQETNVDLIAVAFGNAHGEYKSPPELRYDLVEYTTSRTDIPFVVHGASGLSNEVIKKLLAIKGVLKINVSTEVKLAYLEGIKRAQAKGLMETEGFQAIKVQNIINQAIKELAISKLKL